MAEHFQGADVLNWKDLSPRFAVSFDPFGTGKTAFKAAASDAKPLWQRPLLLGGV